MFHIDCIVEMLMPAVLFQTLFVMTPTVLGHTAEANPHSVSSCQPTVCLCGSYNAINGCGFHVYLSYDLVYIYITGR